MQERESRDVGVFGRIAVSKRACVYAFTRIGWCRTSEILQGAPLLTPLALVFSPRSGGNA